MIIKVIERFITKINNSIIFIKLLELTEFKYGITKTAYKMFLTILKAESL